MNKIGQLPFSIVTMYRVFVVVVVAVVVFGVSSFNSHHIIVRDSEAVIMAREISECLTSEVIIDLGKLRGEEDVFEYCGFEEEEVENFFVSVSVTAGDKEIFEIEGGDSGFLWVKDLYENWAKKDTVDKYEPGHFGLFHDVVVSDSGVKKDAVLILEVVVNA